MSSNDSRSSVSNRNSCDGVNLPDFLCNDSVPTYSYFSTYSSNYTTSGLPGPGRILGNILSRTGSSLERGLGKLAYRTGVGRYAKAESKLQNLSPWFFDKYMTQKMKENVCDMLFGYARLFVISLIPL